MRQAGRVTMTLRKLAVRQQPTREPYADFGPTLAAEMLAERRQIVLAKGAVRRLQIEAGYVSRTSYDRRRSNNRRRVGHALGS